MTAVIATAVLLLGSVATAGASTADVVFLVDESGSMDQEHAWLAGNLVPDLDTALGAEGITAQYALVGFGGHDPGGNDEPHKHLVGGGDFGTAAQFQTAAGTLVDDFFGSVEDGYNAIDYALSNYTLSGDAINFILVTDEDRDNQNGSLTYAGTLAALNREDILLNVIVNADLRNATNGTALGIDADDNAYTADGSGGFTQSNPGSVNSAAGTTEADYIDMAWDTGGAAWDLNQLRTGGNTATSFTEAFVDIKVAEITEQIIPEPMTMAGLMLGVGALGGYVRRRRSA
jgi:hypothetical protein